MKGHPAPLLQKPAWVVRRTTSARILWCVFLLLTGILWAQPAGDATNPPQTWSVVEYSSQAIQLSESQLARIKGTVTGTLGKTGFFLQDTTGALLVIANGETLQAHLGDSVEVVGTRILTSGTPQLKLSELKILGPGTLPEPVSISAKEALIRRLDGLRVRIRGRLTSNWKSHSENRSVLLQADGLNFTADYDPASDDGSDWGDFKPGEMLEVTGPLFLHPGAAKGELPFSVVLQSRHDAVVAGPQPWWMPPRVYNVFFFVGAIIVAALVSAGLLRRQVQERTKEIQDRYEREVAMERRYRELFTNATDVILTHDLDGRITSFNPTGERLLGWSANELLGINISELLAPEERETAGGIIEPRKGLPGGERGAVFKLDLLTRDGRALPFEVSAWVERKNGQPVGMQAICRDISDRKRMEEERTSLERKLQESQKLESLGVLAGGIAHDFNNLLTGIMGNASLALMDLPAGAPIRKCLDQIVHASERAADLCKQMLAYSGHGRFVVERLDLSSLVRDTAELVRSTLNKKANIVLQLEDELPSVVADATQIRQIVMNLVINAGEAIGDEPGLISIRTGHMQADRGYFSDAHHFVEAPDGNYVFLEVSDTGSGMAPETQARIFDPFFTTKFTGRGLGLAAVLGIVRGHRGALKLKSAPGQGSTFRLLLPSAGPMPGQQEFSFLPSAERTALGTVLVVDDEETVRRVTKGILESLGYEALLAKDGVEGVDQFRQAKERIDAVLLDLTMPRMDGAEAFREMRKLHRDVRVLLMSGFAERQALARFAGQGLTGFIQKPFHADALRQKLSTVLNVRNPSESRPSNVIPMVG